MMFEHILFLSAKQKQTISSPCVLAVRGCRAAMRAGAPCVVAGIAVCALAGSPLTRVVSLLDRSSSSINRSLSASAYTASSGSCVHACVRVRVHTS